MTVDNQKKLPVLIIGPGLKQVGGVSTFVEILLSSPLLKEKFDFIHLDTTRESNDLGLENRLSFINLTYLTRQLFQFVSTIFQLKPKLVHLQVTSGLAFWKSAIFILVGKTLGIKTVAHLHGGMFDQYYAGSNPLKQRVIGFIFHCADMVIALSERWEYFLLQKIRPDLHVKVVGNTVDLVFAKALGNTNNSEAKREKIILFLGSVGQRKGVRDILQAAPLIFIEHPDAYFLLAGEEESRGEKLIMEKISKEKMVAEKIRFLGPVTGHAKLDLFQSAMIYILPSYGENLPFALLEAMAVGLPVVTTPVGAIPEIVKDGENGFLIQPGDYQALAKRVNQLLNDRDLRVAMSKANISRIQADFMPESSMKLINDIYDQLASEKN